MARGRKTHRVSSVALCALLLFFAACASQQRGAASPELSAQVRAQVSAAQPGRGFICDGTDQIFACECKWGIPDSDIYSCKGMEALCKALGSKVECDDIWCTCSGIYR